MINDRLHESLRAPITPAELLQLCAERDNLRIQVRELSDSINALFDAYERGAIGAEFQACWRRVRTILAKVKK